MSDIVAFIQAHSGALCALGIAVLDFVFAVNANAKSSGILHWVYVALGGKAE